MPKKKDLIEKLCRKPSPKNFNSMLEYKGYHASVEYDAEDNFKSICNEGD